MTATDAPLAATAMPAEAQTGIRLFASDVMHVPADVRLVFLLADDAWERVVARVFGVAREDQSALVKMLMAGALATVAGGYLARLPRPRASKGDTAMGGFVVNAAVRGLAGAPSQNIPAAGVLIGLAVLARSIRSVATGSTHDVEWLAHGARARYGHHAAPSVDTSRPTRA